MKKVLIANRGEIALRVMRSLKEMDILTVAIYSEADRDAPFVQYADEAVCIGPPPSSESYLLGDKIIDICREMHIDGIHPGYGFLSENAEFTQKVTDAGIIFIGPSPAAMKVMGSKLAAKEAVSKFDIPMVPGVDHAVEDVTEAIQIAKEIGFPVLIKASAGGGGKGMRVVESEDMIEEQMSLAISEAESAFGDGSVFIEKFVTEPRHIEIQILGDSHGNIIHLFERECSIQRRHQKVIEEAPSTILTAELREAMGKAACDVARSCDYHGVGTVEFLLDGDMNFYFLEMNTRLQVEHPVTEMITGIDLVKEQIKVARGEKLDIKQEELKINGHSLELRVYAEDPQNNFLPDIGTLKVYNKPSGPGIRVDDGFQEGMAIPIYYDPMISKLVVHADTRVLAIEKMKRAIQEYEIGGLKNTLAFGAYVMNHEAFRSGNYNTLFIKEHFSPEDLDIELSDDEKEIAALFAVSALRQYKRSSQIHSSNTSKSTQKSKWKNRAR